MEYSDSFWIYLSEFRKMCKESKMLSKVCSVSSHHQCYDSTLPLPPLTHTLNFSRGNRDHKE